MKRNHSISKNHIVRASLMLYACGYSRIRAACLLNVDAATLLRWTQKTTGSRTLDDLGQNQPEMRSAGASLARLIDAEIAKSRRKHPDHVKELP